MFSRTHFFAVSLLLLVPGCLLRSNTVTERFAGEFKCTRDRVTVERPDKNRPDFYRATGCNRRASYQCSGDYGEFCYRPDKKPTASMTLAGMTIVLVCERIGQPETINPEGGALPAVATPDKPVTPPAPPKDGPATAPPAP